MGGNGRKAIMDNFCWSVGTYTCKNQTNNCFNPTEENKVYQRYYQWISLLFILQTCVLHTPAYYATFKHEKWNDQKSRIMLYFSSKYVDRLHTNYKCYFLYQTNVFFFKSQLLNIVMLNVIITGFWNRYSRAILALLTGDPIIWMFHSELIFPRAAKCTYEPYGPSGSNQKLDALCLHQNCK
ncbi:innexin inx4-like [Sitodiplosis mosellana]|uniref:innexin inx4-like n=1 Tax=Sitodiplosis mosellana TaxID=263140 RepID=UPI002444EB6C|nr:innexin inx4-like [Sitodiplosis mosellana]